MSVIKRKLVRRSKLVRKRIIITCLYTYIRRKKNRSCWVHGFNTETKRDSFGYYKTLCQQLEEYPTKYFILFRMEQSIFNMILDAIKNEIEGPGTQFRKSISAKEKLCITLIHLAHAISYTKLALDFRMGISTIWTIVKQVSNAIVKHLLPIYLSPRSTDDWKDIGNEFYRLWQMPNCLGALDGKHIKMFKPRKTGSKYFCYKKHFSIVLLAVCDAHYRFTLAHVGGYGSNCDAGIFAASEFGKAWLSNDAGLQIPEDGILPKSNERFPYYLVADEAFPLKRNLLRPFGGKNLTYKKKYLIIDYLAPDV